MGLISFGENLPSLQNTVFGWTIIGKMSGKQENNGFCGVATLGDLITWLPGLDEFNF